MFAYVMGSVHEIIKDRKRNYTIWKREIEGNLGQTIPVLRNKRERKIEEQKNVQTN